MVAGATAKFAGSPAPQAIHQAAFAADSARQSARGVAGPAVEFSATLTGFARQGFPVAATLAAVALECFVAGRAEATLLRLDASAAARSTRIAAAMRARAIAVEATHLVSATALAGVALDLEGSAAGAFFAGSPRFELSGAGASAAHQNAFSGAPKAHVRTMSSAAYQFAAALA